MVLTNSRLRHYQRRRNLSRQHLLRNLHLKNLLPLNLTHLQPRKLPTAKLR